MLKQHSLTKEIAFHYWMLRRDIKRKQEFKKILKKTNTLLTSILELAKQTEDNNNNYPGSPTRWGLGRVIGREPYPCPGGQRGCIQTTKQTEELKLKIDREPSYIVKCIISPETISALGWEIQYTEGQIYFDNQRIKFYKNKKELDTLRIKQNS